MREHGDVGGRWHRVVSGRAGDGWALVVVALAGVAPIAAGCGNPRTAPVRPEAAPTGAVTTRWTQVVEVTCPGLGSVSVALPSGTATPPLPPEVALSIGYQATDSNTGKTVSGGQPPGDIPCATLPFTDLTSQQLAPGKVPAGVAPGDRLTGNWTVSATVTLAPIPKLPS